MTTRTPFSRLFTIEDRAGPANIPVYQGTTRATGVTVPFGDRTPIREPSNDRYGEFRVAGAVKGEAGLATADLEARYKFTASQLLSLARKGCDFDAQVHFGECQDPQDFNGGWDKVLVMAGASISQWGTNELGALEQGQDAIINEAVPINMLDTYEIVRQSFSELAGTELVQEVVQVIICDPITCGICGIATNGCETFFAITLTTGGSPGLAAEVIFSQDGGTTIGETNITTIGVANDPSGVACIGPNLVVISNEDDALHYAPIADIIAGTETWTRVSSGVVAAGSMNAIISLGTGRTWIAGDGGYLYNAEDITSAVIVQDAGVATTEDLNDIHAFDENNIVAVGANNAVVRSEDGVSWSSVTGPSVGVVLNAIWMRSAREWFIGDAGGQLWYTRDEGVTWTEKTFSGSGAGVIRDIQFATPTVGYMAHDTAAIAGRMLRTIDGGRSWYIMPEGAGAIPANDQINSIAACGVDPNVAYGGGLGDDASDGVLIRARGA